MIEHGQNSQIDQQIPIVIENFDQPKQNIESIKADTEFDGIDIKSYAEKHRIQVAEVWRRIKAGKILARSEKGTLLIYQQTAPSPLFVLEPRIKEDVSRPKKEMTLKPKEEDLSSLPPPPKVQPSHLPEAPISENFSSRYTENSTSLMKTPEVALLLDHLSLAKEENKELLKMTRESIHTVTKMSERIVSLKDEIISEKNQQLDFYKSKLAEQEKLIKILNQKNEDLEMLTKTMLES